MLLAALCAVTSPAYAREIGEIQATSIDLGGFRGVVYYTSEGGGYRVVTTIAEGENGLPVRFERHCSMVRKSLFLFQANSANTVMPSR